MKYILKFFASVFRFLFKYWRFFPRGLAGLYIVTNLILDIIKYGPVVGFGNAAQTLFASELTLNQGVHMALANSPQYGIPVIIDIIVAVIVLYTIIKWFGKWIFIGVTGSQAPVMAYTISIFVVAIIEMLAIKIIDGTLGFIPIWDGLIFAFMNIDVLVSALF